MNLFNSKLVPVLLLSAACAPDLRLDHPFDGQVSEGPLVSTQVLSGDVKVMNIDATNKNSQVYVDLDLGVELKADEAFATNAWDLAFKRFEISMNGGAGGPTGSVRVAVLKNADFDALTTAPKDGYQQDTATQVFNGVEGGWYVYDIGKHKLVTREDLMYVVQTSAGAYFKVKMIDYYDATGTPAAISLKYGPIAAP